MSHPRGTGKDDVVILAGMRKEPACVWVGPARERGGER